MAWGGSTDSALRLPRLECWAQGPGRCRAADQGHRSQLERAIGCGHQEGTCAPQSCGHAHHPPRFPDSSSRRKDGLGGTDIHRGLPCFSYSAQSAEAPRHYRWHSSGGFSPAFTEGETEAQRVRIQNPVQLAPKPRVFLPVTPTWFSFLWAGGRFLLLCWLPAATLLPRQGLRLQPEGPPQGPRQHHGLSPVCEGAATRISRPHTRRGQ